MPVTVEEALQLLRALQAPPALVHHHELVVETANELCAGVLTRFPQLSLDIELVLCGAALHDVGKVRVPEGLKQSEETQESAGEALLLTLGVPPEVAACCSARSRVSERSSLELLLVALADALWKGSRDKLLEQAFADRLCAQLSVAAPEVWVAVNDLMQRTASHGPRRLAEAERVHPRP